MEAKKQGGEPMEITRIGRIRGGQDGAIFGSLLFRLDHTGHGAVYDLAAPIPEDGRLIAVAELSLDGSSGVIPHSNAVFFGKDRYTPEDEFPLLYSNVYNNCASCKNPRIGTLCAYRLAREEGGIVATLVQTVRVGFCEDAALWRATEEAHGVRPYGNFLYDPATDSLWAFVMRDEARGTRYFRFPMPSVRAGETEPTLGVPEAVLGAEDIAEQFDMPFYRFVQGAALFCGRIYSTEGFDHSEANPPAIRVVDLTARRESYHSLPELDIHEEPEMIDFYRGECYYSDANGNLYTVKF